ncbi:hypothetical protein HDU96_006649 [Phlyctochytrium bullatum]|nr:hypothetical protein HDU96_006649 [Phlyctochytrium bullatum]
MNRNVLSIHTVPLHLAVTYSSQLTSAAHIADRVNVFLREHEEEHLIAPHVLEQLNLLHQELEWEARAGLAERKALVAPPPPAFSLKTTEKSKQAPRNKKNKKNGATATATAKEENEDQVEDSTPAEAPKEKKKKKKRLSEAGEEDAGEGANKPSQKKSKTAAAEPAAAPVSATKKKAKVSKG